MDEARKCYADPDTMAKRNVVIGPRDLDILSALEHCPLTPAQLLKLSSTFSRPFPEEHTLRRRLRLLSHRNLLRQFPYAVASGGRSPHYARLTRDGYRLLHGPDTTLPHRRHFEAISHAHHHHTRALAEFLVHTLVSAQQVGMTVPEFSPENALKIEAGLFTLYPDSAFAVQDAAGRRFRFVVELDNGTERVRSRLDTESIERKVRGYDLHQSGIAARDPERFVVLFVCARGPDRLAHILELAGELTVNARRRVFLGTTLKEFLMSPTPLTEDCFRDIHAQPCALIDLAEKAA